MAQTRLESGAVLHTLNPDELAAGLDKFARDLTQEKARGVGTWRGWKAATVAATDITVPAVGDGQFGPRRGFAVGVRDVRVRGLATNDSVDVFRNSNSAFTYLRTITAASPFTTFGSGGCILRSGEGLVIVGAGLAATGDIVVNAEGEEVPDVDVYKLF